MAEDVQRLSWEQRRSRAWTCREGGRIWPELDGDGFVRRWRWRILGAEGACEDLPGAIGAAGDAWRKAQGRPA